VKLTTSLCPAEVKNVWMWSCTSIPLHVLMAWYFVKTAGSFILASVTYVEGVISASIFVGNAVPNHVL